MRPFFPYYGSKWNAARRYPAPRGRVVEPFAGSAGYSLFYDARDVLLIDKDPIVVGVWQYLTGVTAAEIEALPLVAEVGDSVDNYDIPQEAKWLIGFWLNRGSASPKKSRTAYSADTARAQLVWSDRAKRRIVSQLDGLAGWNIQEGDFADAPNVSATWFVDPPYVDKGKYYRVPFADFDRLAAWSQSRAGRVIVCEGAEADWLPFEVLGDLKTSLGKARELVWLRDTAIHACPDCGLPHDPRACAADGAACDCCAAMYQGWDERHADARRLDSLELEAA